eukprot:5429254-Amphidinium_carterae.1
MVKAVPGFLQVSDVWRWVISNAVALFSGPTVCAQQAFTAPANDTPSSRWFFLVSLDGCLHWPLFQMRLLTGFGLDFLAGMLSGPRVDRATLQLLGVFFASILLPGSGNSGTATEK